MLGIVSGFAASRRIALAGAALAALLAAAPAARARDLPAVPTPFEVGDSRSGNYLAALVAGASRDTFAAATYFRETLRSDPGNLDLLDRTFVASLANGDMNEAFGYADQLVRRQPDSTLARLALAGREFGRKRYAAARQQLSKNSVSRLRDVTATLLSAWAFAGAKDAKAALEQVDRLKDPAFTVFRDYHAALILDVLGQGEEAIKRMKAAYEEEKTTLRLVDAYARLLSKRGKGEEALAIYKEFAKTLPRHPIVLASIADLEAGRPLKPFVTDAKEGAAEALYGLGAAGGRPGDELATMIYLRLSLYLAPQNAMALMSLADAYERTKQYERAIDVYRLTPESSPLRPTAEVQAALTLEQLGRVEDAVKQMRAIVEERPTDVDALMALGNLETSRKDYAAAVAAFEKAGPLVKAEPGFWSFFYRRGIAYERNKQWDKAQADFRQALALYPEQPLVLNYLGYSWVDRGENLDEAFKMLRRAVELRPTDGYIVDSLGWAHFKLGRYDEAVSELERAVELRPSDPVINDHLGDAYWRVGRKLEAQFQWNHARDLKPEPEDLTRILKKIEYGLEDDKPKLGADAAPGASAPQDAPQNAPKDAPKPDGKQGG